MGFVIGVKAEMIDEYRRLHAAVWPDVLAKIHDCNIRNYTIYLREPENLLFAHYEYHGTDFATDTARMAADPVTQDWWRLTAPCQHPLSSAAPGETWSPLADVFHID